MVCSFRCQFCLFYLTYWSHPIYTLYFTLSTVPDDKDRAFRLSKPFSNPFEESKCVIGVAIALIPDEALSIGEVIGAIPVDAI
jgi:hypothetical protein